MSTDLISTLVWGKCLWYLTDGLYLKWLSLRSFYLKYVRVKRTVLLCHTYPSFRSRIRFFSLWFMLNCYCCCFNVTSSFHSFVLQIHGVCSFRVSPLTLDFESSGSSHPGIQCRGYTLYRGTPTISDIVGTPLPSTFTKLRDVICCFFVFCPYSSV